MKLRHIGVTDVFGQEFTGPFYAATADGRTKKDFPVLIECDLKHKHEDKVLDAAWEPDAKVLDYNGNVVCTCKDNVTASRIRLALNAYGATSEECCLFKTGNPYGIGHHQGAGDVMDSEHTKHFWAITVNATYTVRATGETEVVKRFIATSPSPLKFRPQLTNVHGATRFSSLKSTADAIRMINEVILKRPEVIRSMELLRKSWLKAPIERCPKTVEIDWATMKPVCVRFMYEVVYEADVNRPPKPLDIYYNRIPDPELEKELAHALEEHTGETKAADDQPQGVDQQGQVPKQD